jgi:anti-sigma factor RsiW
MRCGRAQQLMIAAVDAELGERRRRALDRHVAECADCRRELAATEGVLRAVAALPSEAAVSTALEQATLRRVRLAAAEEQERPARPWWRWSIPTFAIATAAVVVLAVGVLRRTEMPAEAPVVAVAPVRPDNVQVARAAKPKPAPAPGAPVAEARHEPVPNEPPAELAARPDLFVEMPILRNMEKLDHFEAIRTTTIEDAPAPSGEPGPSNG